MGGRPVQTLRPSLTGQLSAGNIDATTYREERNLNKWDGPFSEIDPKKGIRNGKDDVGFSGAPDTVDMLDAIEIGKYTT